MKKSPSEKRYNLCNILYQKEKNFFFEARND